MQEMVKATARLGIDDPRAAVPAPPQIALIDDQSHTPSLRELHACAPFQEDAIYTQDGLVGAGCSQGTTRTFIYAP
jgi:hypothetical protein